MAEGLPQWFVPLYPFTLKLIFDKQDGTANINSTEFFDITDGFIRDELESKYPGIFESLDLMWEGDGEVMSCVSDEYSPIYSSRHGCVQSSSTGYALFELTSETREMLPSRDELGNFKLELFRRGKKSRTKYINMLENEATNLNLKATTDVYLTLNIIPNNSSFPPNNKFGQNLSTNNSADDDFHTVNAVSLAAIIAAGAIFVLVAALIYSWHRRVWLEKLADNDSETEELRRISGAGISSRSLVSIRSEDHDVESVSARDIEITNTDSMMGMSALDECDTMKDMRGTPKNVFNRTYYRYQDDAESVVSKESYAFSFGDFEVGDNKSLANKSVRFTLDEQFMYLDKSITSNSIKTDDERQLLSNSLSTSQQ